MKGLDFDYNTSRERLILPEYGRNVQKLVKHIATITNREERNLYAQALIQVMGNLNPHLRDINDFKHKLWDHLAIISDFKCDYDSPYPIPTSDIITEKPKRVSYGTNNPRFKHYGKNVEHLIEKACKMEEGQDRQDFILILANMMKRFYFIWNKETIADEVILNDLRELSKGKLSLPMDTRLEEIRVQAHRPPQKKTSNYRNYQNGGSHGGHSHSNHSNHNYKKRY